MWIIEFADKMGKRVDSLKRWQANLVMILAVPLSMAVILSLNEILGLQATNAVGELVKGVCGFFVGLWLWFVISGLLASLINRSPE